MKTAARPRPGCAWIHRLDVPVMFSTSGPRWWAFDVPVNTGHRTGWAPSWQLAMDVVNAHIRNHRADR